MKCAHVYALLLKGRNGIILIAASWGSVFRCDEKLFTNLTNKLVRADLGSSGRSTWKPLVRFH